MKNAFVERAGFVFWFGPAFGGTEMSPQRRRGVEVLNQFSEIHFELVTEENLAEWIVPEDPLHSGFPFLSATHKSDYLRSYFMFHYGGAYSDLKPYTFSWQQYFEKLDKSEREFIGQRQLRLSGLSVRARMPFWCYVCDSYFIFKQHTDFALAWKQSVKQVLDRNLEKLKDFPGTYHPRATRRGFLGATEQESWKSGYPFGWMDLQGKVFQPLQHQRSSDFLKGMPQEIFEAQEYR